jgi:hypothetical protein
MKYPLGEELALGKEKASKPKKKERLLRARREEALAMCEAGLQDPLTHLSKCLSLSGIYRSKADYSSQLQSTNLRFNDESLA